jgi:hypothetical protein
MPPFLYGGDMIAEGRVLPDLVEYNCLLWKYAAGTPNILGAIVSAQALRMLLDLALSPKRPVYFGTSKPLGRHAVQDAMGRITAWNRQLTARARRGLAAARSGKAVHPVDVAARHIQRGVVLADGLFVRPVEQAVHLAPGVVVQLDLAHAELIGPAVAGVIGDLRDGLGGQLQILVEVHESCHDMLLRSM